MVPDRSCGPLPETFAPEIGDCVWEFCTVTVNLRWRLSQMRIIMINSMMMIMITMIQIIEPKSNELMFEFGVGYNVMVLFGARGWVFHPTSMALQASVFLDHPCLT